HDSTIVAEVSSAGLDGKLNPEEALTAALLYSASQMSTALLFTRGSISSLYEDESHPSFGLRISRFAEMLAAQGSANSTFDKYVSYFRAKVERVDSLRRRGLIEIHSDGPIANLAFDDNGLLLVDRDWNLYRVSKRDLSKALTKRSSSLRPRMIGRVP